MKFKEMMNEVLNEASSGKEGILVKSNYNDGGFEKWETKIRDWINKIKKKYKITNNELVTVRSNKKIFKNQLEMNETVKLSFIRYSSFSDCIFGIKL